jgi:N-methylhydantoinase B
MGGGMTQIAAANLGEKRVIELAKRYGIDTLSSAFYEIISYGERRMREKIKVISEGIYKAEDCLEGIENNELTWIRVKLKREYGNSEERNQ